MGYIPWRGMRWRTEEDFCQLIKLYNIIICEDNLRTILYAPPRLDIRIYYIQVFTTV
ncbi:MAG: hypothetical protein XD72_1392 [Methanothrix harundinacea]|uniref:Uncharacterized protein n=1 Tax=Methanothrix harundinacea TaxID=301375 RepID=A0A117LFF9_9EURY|nr:MAG: hypothetical protein XD72_1392 [Methanothrix harundinacea]